MMKKRVLLLPICWLVASSVFAYQKPIPLAPMDGLEDLPYAGISFRWDNNNPDAQIERIGFSLRETIADGSYFSGDDVGECGWRRFYIGGERTSIHSSECNGGELKPNQWHKWQLMLEFVGGGSIGMAAWFKTGPKSQNVKIFLDSYKLEGFNWEDWITIGVDRAPRYNLSQTQRYTIESIYYTAGIDMKVQLNEDDIKNPPPKDKEGYTIAEYHSFIWGPKGKQSQTPDGYWPIPFVLLNRLFGDQPELKPSSVGLVVPILDEDENIYRVTVALFKDTIKIRHDVKELKSKIKEMSLNVAVHEIGHALYLNHSDARKESEETPASIMVKTPAFLSDNWDYEWSSDSLAHFYEHDVELWRPNREKPFYLILGIMPVCHGWFRSWEN